MASSPTSKKQSGDEGEGEGEDVIVCALFSFLELRFQPTGFSLFVLHITNLNGQLMDQTEDYSECA